MPLGIELEVLRKTTPSLKIDKQIQTLEQWQIAAKEKLKELLGMEFFEKCEYDIKVLKIENNEKFLNIYF